MITRTNHKLAASEKLDLQFQNIYAQLGDPQVESLIEFAEYLVKEHQSADAPGESERRNAYPFEFLGGISGRAEETLRIYFKVHGLPKIVFTAITDMIYLEFLIGFYRHSVDFKPDGTAGYNRELEDFVKSIAWSTQAVDELARAKIQSMSNEEYKAASEWGNEEAGHDQHA